MTVKPWVPMVLLMACGASREEPVFEATKPLPWVNPARCLQSCSHLDASGLVTVDENARLAADGRFRLRPEAQPALAAMFAAAAKESLMLSIGSAYRTYDEQAALWNELSVTQPGRPARPGHSEHETGLTVDLSFAPPIAMFWPEENAWRFGFVISYPQFKQKVTGFNYERWHVRFVGSEVAAQLHDRGTTLEEFFASNPGLGVSGDCSDCPLESSRSDCSALTDAGVCDGQVLRWCFSGAAGAVDCAASSLICAVNDCVVP